jgi:hypothetical protein
VPRYRDLDIMQAMRFARRGAIFPILATFLVVLAWVRYNTGPFRVEVRHPHPGPGRSLTVYYTRERPVFRDGRWWFTEVGGRGVQLPAPIHVIRCDPREADLF